MKKYFFIFVFIYFWPGLVFAESLECIFTKYGNSGYKESTARSWVPEVQTHNIDGQNIFWEQAKELGSGSISENNSSRIKFQYTSLSTDSKGAKAETKFKYTFHKTTNKVAVKVIFTGYLPINHIWGKCEVKE